MNVEDPGTLDVAPLPAGAASASSGFHLLRYFSVAAACAFALVMVALAFFEWRDREAFVHAQVRQTAQFRQAQEQFARQQDEAARRDLLVIHEAGHVNLARLFANALWESHLAPFAQRAQALSIEACRALPQPAARAGPASSPTTGTTAGARVEPNEAARRACFAEFGRSLMADRDFAAIDRKIYEAMKRSTVFKVKVFDLRGIALYSSEHAQIGEDKSGNAGWHSAALEGKARSELTFRDRFSSFEGVVEKRDLISSTLPLHESGGTRIVGVFEIYSDVSPFLAQIKTTAAQVRQAAAANQAAAQAAATVFHDDVRASARNKMLTVLGLLLALFGALYFVVRHADTVLARQAEERAHAQRQLVQAERSASLGQMVAGVAHQLNTPLAYSRNNLRMATERLRELELPLKVAGSLARLVSGTEHDRVTLDVSRARSQLRRVQGADLDVQEPLDMLADTLHGIEQMRELVENLRDFTRLDRSQTAQVDINRVLHNVVYIARCVVPEGVRIVEDYSHVPPLHCNVSQLNQVFLNLVNNAAQAISGEGVVTVSTRAEREGIVIDVSDTGCGIAPDVLPLIFEDYFTTKAGVGTGLGLPIARSIVREHGGEISVDTTQGAGSRFTVILPLAAAAGHAVAAAEPAIAP